MRIGVRVNEIDFGSLQTNEPKNEGSHMSQVTRSYGIRCLSVSIATALCGLFLVACQSEDEQLSEYFEQGAKVGRHVGG